MRIKRRYRVIKHEIHDSGDGYVNSIDEAVGETWAVSPAKAISNVCFRNKTTAKGYVPWHGDGCRRWYHTAEEMGV